VTARSRTRTTHAPGTETRAATDDDTPRSDARWSRRLHVALPDDVDVPWTLRHLVARTVPSLEHVTPDAWLRVVRTVDGPMLLHVAHDAADAALVVRASPSPGAAALQAMVVRAFDLGTDLAPFRALARRDPILAPLVRRRPALRLPQYLDPFEAMIRAILGQQVSVAGAATLADRLVRAYGESVALPADVPPLRAFPRATALAEAGGETLRAVGLTRAKAAAIAGVAARVAEGTLDLEALRTRPAAEAEATLVALPGIGPWTAQWLRLRALGDADAFPVKDLGVIKAFAARDVSPAAIAGRAEAWRPWRGYATLHLWESLANR
jgi:3-methyladenine DNA glycosylase/8-oxoguanine DNA glycosylase